MKKKNLVSDLISGLTSGIADIPDGMASAVLAGANPVFGLNALMVGKPIGALLTSSQFMAVSTTGAIALTAGNSLVGLGGDEHARALFTLTLLAGIIQVAAGLLDLGRLMRFVSNAVMVGFLTGVSVVIVLSQLGDLTGYTSAYSNNLVKAIDLFFNPRQVDPQSLAVGLLTLVLISALARTRLRNFAMLLAMLIASFARFFLSWDQVRVVGDVAEITGSQPGGDARNGRITDRSRVPIHRHERANSSLAGWLGLALRDARHPGDDPGVTYSIRGTGRCRAVWPGVYRFLGSRYATGGNCNYA